MIQILRQELAMTRKRKKWTEENDWLCVRDKEDTNLRQELAMIIQRKKWTEETDWLWVREKEESIITEDSVILD